MNVERFIAVYDKDNDSLLEDIKIDLATDVLIDLLNIDRNDDPDAYKVYHLTEAQFERTAVFDGAPISVRGLVHMLCSHDQLFLCLEGTS